MDNKFRMTMNKVTGASQACTAWSTAGEVDEIIDQTVEWAAKRGENHAVFVWRESVGFEEYGVYVDNDNGSVRVQTLPLDAVGYRIKKIEGQTHAPADDFPGATVPFAVEFISNWSAREEGRPAIFVLRDWHRYIDANADHVDRQLALFEKLTQGAKKHVIAIGQPEWDDENIPVELSPYMYRERLELPNKAERLGIAMDWKRNVELHHSAKYPKVLALDNEYMEMLADATGGLTRKQTEDIIVMSISATMSMDIDFVLAEKKKLVEQAGYVITRPEMGFEVIGGLGPLKEWVSMMRYRFTKEAFDYGFDKFPSGLLMAGVPGCGKSALAKAMAYEWGMNMITVEAENLKGSLVGESEKKVGTLLRTARAAAPLILFVDEAEKLLGKSDGVHDGGAHDAVLGQFLSFMQEDNTGLFFVFTANNMSKFAPELVDRFEGRYFIDLPSADEREDILAIHLKKRKQDPDSFDMKELVRESKDFSGRNIEQAIVLAMTRAFSEGQRKLTQEDLLTVFKGTIPTSKTKKTEIETMRTFVENGMMVGANTTSKSSEDSGDDAGRLRSFA